MRLRCFATALLIFLLPMVSGRAQHHPDLGTLADFPMANEVWLAATGGLVVVNPEVEISISRPGAVKWEVESGERVNEGDVIAVSGWRAVELSAQSLEHDREKARQSLRDLEWSNEDKRTSLRNTIRDLEEQLSRLEMTPQERALLGSNFERRLERERGELQAELARARERFESDYYDRSLELEKRALNLELERAEHEYAELLRASEVLAEASGIIEIRSTELIRTTSVVGVIVREGVAEVVTQLSDPRLQHLPGGDLAIEVPGDDGRIYRGRYLREADQPLDRNARAIVFELIGSTEGEPVPESLAGSRMCRLFRILQQTGHLVPKDDLLFRYPEEIARDGWNRFIESRWDGATVVYVGPRDVLVAAKDEN